MKGVIIMIIDINDSLVSGIRISNNDKIEFGINKNKLVFISPIGIKLDMDIDEDNLKQAVQRSNSKFMAENRRLEYSYHKETKRYVIKVIDSSTNE